jgi:lipocalin-like protein
MFARPVTRRFQLMVMAVLMPLVVSCSDDESTGPDSDPLVGTWQVTSFEALGVDAIDLGMSMQITLTAAKTYTFVITNDALGSCDGATSCTQSGTYSSTSTQITFDPGDPDEVTLNHSAQGTTMTLTGDIDGDPVTIVLQRQ